MKKGDIIQISFVGYQTVEIPWDGQPMNVTLQDDTQTLGEVVVTALVSNVRKKHLVIVPLVVPFTTTDAPITVSPVASTTTPVQAPFCCCS